MKYYITQRVLQRVYKTYNTYKDHSPKNTRVQKILKRHAYTKNFHFDPLKKNTKGTQKP